MFLSRKGFSCFDRKNREAREEREKRERERGRDERQAAAVTHDVGSRKGGRKQLTDCETTAEAAAAAGEQELWNEERDLIPCLTLKPEDLFHTMRVSSVNCLQPSTRR